MRIEKVPDQGISHGTTRPHKKKAPVRGPSDLRGLLRREDFARHLRFRRREDPTIVLFVEIEVPFPLALRVFAPPESAELYARRLRLDPETRADRL